MATVQGAIPDESTQADRYEFSLHSAGTFSVSWELVPGRGAFERTQLDLFNAATKAAASCRVHALSIADNPGGNLALSAEMLGAELCRMGIEPLIHLTCKDKNRNQLESLLYGLERAGARNLLVMTGDLPKGGFQGAPKPVFDLDSVTLLELVRELNNGRVILKHGGKTKLLPASFFAGAVVSPFKMLEAEQMGQYYKLKRKLAAGAQFVVSQLGFDARKMHELLQVMRLLGYEKVPAVGNIYLLSPGAARALHRNALPGCEVSDKLLRDVEAEAAAPDKGRAKRLERAAKMYAVLKGMGYAGVHIAGPGMTFDDLMQVIDQGEEHAASWPELVREFDYSQTDAWYYFARDKKTGLNSTVPAARSQPSSAGIGYRALRVLHQVAFTPEGALFGPMRALAARVNGSKLESAYAICEQAIKTLSHGCRHCGDCALLDLAYLCPMNECAKFQRNGPCGGSHEGWCEKYPGRHKCLYVRAYDRLKSHGAEASLGEDVIPPANYDLADTSSWINFYLGRDHSAKKLGIENVPPGTERNRNTR